MKPILHGRILLYALGILALAPARALPVQILWEDDFSSPSWMNNYDMNQAQNFAHIPGGGPGGNGCVEITVVKDQHYGGAMRYMLMQHLGYEPEELYAEYRVRYDQDMETYAGKAPGFSGTYDTAGWGNQPGYGLNGWSARGSLSCNSQNYARNAYYVYHTFTDYQNAPAPYTGISGPYASTVTWGSTLHWGPTGSRDDSDMDFDQWYHVKQYIKLNDPGVDNGILKAWVDGTLVYEVYNVNFRRVSSLKIYAYWFNYYHGGSAVAPQTGHVQIDDFKLYIDTPVPVAGVSVDPATVTIDQFTSFQLTATVTPSNASNPAVIWSSDDTGIVTVSDGLITGISPGTATVTATTADGGFTDNCTVTVSPASSVLISFSAIHDVHVSHENPNSNYGSNTKLALRNDNYSSGFNGFMMFDVDTGGIEITSAKLKLYCSHNDIILTVHHVSDNSWTESTMTWNNQPAIEAAVDSHATGLDAWNEFDVTARVTGGGKISFAFMNNEASYSNVDTKEGINPPVLEVLAVIDNDLDNDGLPNDWEAAYFGNITNALASGHGDSDDQDNLSEYISGTDPTNPASFFSATGETASSGFIVSWNAVSNREYAVRYTGTLTNGFYSLVDGILYPQNSYTDTAHQAESAGFYQVDVQRSP